MKKLLLILALALAGYVSLQDWIRSPAFNEAVTSLDGDTDTVIASAFESQIGDFQVQGQGVVVRVLSDDVDGDRHQRFIIRLGNGQTLLVAHNIDLAPRVSDLGEGSTVEFNGEYEWNPQGGVIHWTHHDPQGIHVDGWLQHNGRTYQ